MRGLSRACSGLRPALRWVVVPAYLVVGIARDLLLGQQLGTEIFPQVDAGQFQFRLRAPDGTRIEQTEAITREALDFIGKEVGPENVADHSRLCRRGAVQLSDQQRLPVDRRPRRSRDARVAQARCGPQSRI